MSKKKFKDTGLGKMLLGAVGIISPTLGSVIEGVTSPKEAIAEITKSDLSNEDKIKIQQLIYEQQNKEIEAITTRWKADAASDSWLSKNVRPLVLIWCICIFSLAGILDSIEAIDFKIDVNWIGTFEKVMLAVVLAYFGGRTTEKASHIFKKRQFITHGNSKQLERKSFLRGLICTKGCDNKNYQICQ